MDHLEGLLPLEDNKINSNEVENVKNCVKLDDDVVNGVQSLTLGKGIVDVTPDKDVNIDLDDLRNSLPDKTLDLVSDDFTDEEDYRSTPTEVHKELSKIFEDQVKGEVVSDDVNTLVSDDVNTLDSGYNSSMGEQDKTKSPKSTISARSSTSPNTSPSCNGALSPRSKRLLFSPEKHRKHVSNFREREIEKKKCLEERRRKQNEELERKKQAILKKHDEADKRLQERVQSPKMCRPHSALNVSGELQKNRAFGSTNNISSNRSTPRLRRPLSMGSLPTNQVDAAHLQQSEVSRRSISPFREPSHLRAPQVHTKPIIMSRTKTDTADKRKSRLDLGKLLKPTMTTKPKKEVEPKKTEPVKKRESLSKRVPIITKREPIITKREPMKSPRDRRSMPAGYKLDLRHTKDMEHNEVQKSTTLKRKSSLNTRPKQPSKETLPKALISPTKDNAPKIMNQTMQNKVHDQEAAKQRLEEARRRAREERARQEEEEKMLEEERRKEEERQRVAAEEAKERLIKEKEQRRKAQEEEERKEEERIKLEEEERVIREKEEIAEKEARQREEQLRLVNEAEIRRQKDEERFIKEEEERRERQKKLDAILKRTSGKKSVNSTTSTKREISANASAILAKHNIHIPLLTQETKEETDGEKLKDEVCHLIQIQLQDQTEEDMSFPAPTVNTELSQAL